MGLEARCRARVEGRWHDGLARLEDKELVFRGEVRVRAPLAGMSAVQARRGVLSLRAGGRELAFELGAAAEDWARRILHPRSRQEKLGVKPGLQVAVVGLEDEAFRAELEKQGAVLRQPRGAGTLDMAFLFCESRGRLARMESLLRALRPQGAIWVLWPKGGPGLREQDVREAGTPLGLVDVKVVSFSERLSGLKMMIRRERRG